MTVRNISKEKKLQNGGTLNSTLIHNPVAFDAPAAATKPFQYDWPLEEVLLLLVASISLAAAPDLPDKSRPAAPLSK